MPQSHRLLNMNIEGNINDRGQPGFMLHNLLSAFYIQSETDAIICKTFFNSKNSFNFRPLMIFQTETETWVCKKDVRMATDYDNICFHALR